MDVGISGKLIGRVNGDSVSAIMAGRFDTRGISLNNFSLYFEGKAPNGFNPIVAGYCYKCSYCPNSFLPISLTEGKVQNFSALVGERYIASRSVRFSTLSSENRIDIVSEVSVVDGKMEAVSSSIEGVYNGPIDAIGVRNAEQLWGFSDEGTFLRVKTTADVVLASGVNLPVQIETSYGPIDGTKSISMREIPSIRGRLIYGNEMWDGKRLAFDWVGVVYG